MRLQHIAEQVFYKPWLITPAGHLTVKKLLESKMRMDGGPEGPAIDPGAVAAFVNPRCSAYVDGNGIGHLHICGVIGHRLSGIEKTCGNTDVLDISNELDSLMAQGAMGILIRVDSPGGMVTGVPELAGKIADYATEVPIYSYTDSLMASAAYWLSCAAGRLIASPSAEIGSVGVFIPWVDQSASWGAQGLKFEPIVNEAGTFKAAGMGPSLTDAQREEFQRQVDRLYENFSNFVIDQRRDSGAGVEFEALQGQVVTGDEGLTLGLCDQNLDVQSAYDALAQSAGVIASYPVDWETTTPAVPAPVRPTQRRVARCVIREDEELPEDVSLEEIIIRKKKF